MKRTGFGTGAVSLVIALSICNCPSAAGKTYMFIAQKATPTEVFAARELQRYVDRMTGDRPVLYLDAPAWGEPAALDGTVFIIGDTRHSGPVRDQARKLGPDGFVTRRQGNLVFMTGGGDRGTLQAVYSYLRLAGCRWFSPAEEDEYVPKLKALPHEGVDQVYRPWLTWHELADFTSVDEAWIDWSVKNGMNRAGHQSRLDAAWGHVIAEQWRPRGGTIPFRFFGHSFRQLVPPGLLAERPELFALIDGQRRAEAYDSYWQTNFATQFCTTNPKAVARVIEQAIEWFDRNPDYDFFSLVPVDGGQWCQCESCRALDSPNASYPARNSTRMLALANRVAEAVSKKHPGKKILILAYDNYLVPPEGVPVHPNVMVQVCIWPCFQQPCSRQTGDSAIYTKALEAWARKTQNVALWTYELYAATGAPPAASLRAMAQDRRWFKKIGVKGMLTQFRQDVWTQQPLAVYAWRRLAWDPSVEVRDIIRDFCAGYFGPAAEPMEKLYATVEDANEQRNATAPIDVYAPDVVDKVKALLDAAERAVGDDALRKKRVAVVRSQVEHAARLAPPEIDPSQWIHVAFTYDFPAGRFVLHLDGRRVAELKENVAQPTQAPVMIVGREFGRAGIAQGMIDELRICNAPRDDFAPAESRDENRDSHNSVRPVICTWAR